MYLYVRYPDFYLHLAAPDALPNDSVVVVDRSLPTPQVVGCTAACDTLGITTGMPEMEAFALARGARFVALDPDALETAIMERVALLEGYSPEIEVNDPTRYLLQMGRSSDYGRLKQEAADLQSALPERTRIGIGPNRFVAELAALRPKAHLVEPGEEADFVARCSVHALPVSREIVRRLELLGISSFEQLRRIPTRRLTQQFGAQGKQIAQWALGQDERRMDALAPETVYLAAHEFEIAAETVAHVMSGVEELLSELFAAMKSDYRLCTCVRLRLHPEGADALLHEVRFASPLDDTERALRAIQAQLEQLELSSGLQRLELRLDGLVAGFAQQMSLLPLTPEEQRSQGVRKLVDRLRARATRGSLMQVRWRERASRIPERRAVLEDLVFPQHQRPLGLPRPIRVVTGPSGFPRLVSLRRGWVAVDWLMEQWEIEEEWWTAAPIMRSYYRVMLKDGQLLRLFRDRYGGGWFRQQV